MAKNLLFLFGPDTFRSREKLASIKARYIDASLGDTNLALLSGRALTFEQWSWQVQALPFLAKSRLVIIENLLLEGPKDLQEQISQSLTSIPLSSVVVLYEAGDPDRRTKVFKLVKTAAQSQEFMTLTGRPLLDWIVARAEQSNLRLTEGSKQLLARAVGGDLWRLNNELAKLAAMNRYQSSSIEQALVETSILQEQSADVFHLIEAIARAEPTRALTELHQLLKQGQAELYLFSMIVYQMRTLILIAEGWVAGDRTASALAKRLGMSPYVIEKNLSLAKQQPLATWETRFLLLLDYDWAIKTGQLEPQLALELLIIELTESGHGKQPLSRRHRVKSLG